MWDIFTQLTEKDCPSAVDALAFLYAAYCVLAVFLMAGAIAWLVSIKLLPSRGRVAPTDGHDHGDGTGLLVVSQPVATPGKA